jgi:hypothetical protein
MMVRGIRWAMADSVVAESVIADSLVILIGHVRSLKGHQ